MSSKNPSINAITTPSWRYACPIALVVLALAPHLGHAQSSGWTITYEKQGTGTATGLPGPTNWANYPGSDACSVGMMSPQFSAGTCSASTSGTITVVATYSGTQRPNTLWLRVKSTANGQSLHTGASGGTVSNGFSDDPIVPTGVGKSQEGVHIKRFSVNSNVVKWPIKLSSSFTDSSNGTYPMYTGAACRVVASVAGVSANLERTDGGVADSSLSKDDVFVGHTLLSWPVSEGSTAPGPTYQQLTGTFAGLSTNSVVTWTGAANGLTLSQPNNPSTYPQSSTGGAMPSANDTLGSLKQTWTYQVQDSTSENAKLNLTWNWICHYAFEDVSTSLVRDYSIQPIGHSETVYLSTPGSTGVVNVPVCSTTASTSFDVNDLNSNIPGFSFGGKHIANTDIQSRWGLSTTYSNSGNGQNGAFTVKYDGNAGAGYYGISIDLVRDVHSGTATGWNSKGESTKYYVKYYLDNEARIVRSVIYSENDSSL